MFTEPSRLPKGMWHQFGRLPLVPEPWGTRNVLVLRMGDQGQLPAAQVSGHPQGRGLALGVGEGLRIIRQILACCL